MAIPEGPMAIVLNNLVFVVFERVSVWLIFILLTIHSMFMKPAGNGPGELNCLKGTMN